MKYKQLGMLTAFMLTVTLTSSAQGPAPYKQSLDSARYYTLRVKDYGKALQFYEASFAKGNKASGDYYNAGCCASLTQKKDLAFRYLKKSIQLGYMDQKWMLKDKDLLPLQSDPQWPALIAEFDKQLLAIEKQFAGIRNMKQSDLIPYRSAGLWGYLDKRTKKVVVKAAFTSLGFMNNCAEFTYTDPQRILLLSPDAKVTHKPMENVGAGDVVSPYDEDLDDPKAISSVNGFKGFNLDAKGKIISYSDIYKDKTIGFFDVRGPFKINNVNYAIVAKSKRYGIIDQEGNPLPGFDFVHKYLLLNPEATDTLKWFYVTDTLKQSGFISQHGDKRCEGELKSYPFVAYQRFGISIQRDGKGSGLMDLRKMEWVLKPQPIQITGAALSHNAACGKGEWEIKDEEVNEVYYLVETGLDAYYMDRNGKRYQPE